MIFSHGSRCTQTTNQMHTCALHNNTLWILMKIKRCNGYFIKETNFISISVCFFSGMAFYKVSILERHKLKSIFKYIFLIFLLYGFHGDIYVIGLGQCLCTCSPSIFIPHITPCLPSPLFISSFLLCEPSASLHHHTFLFIYFGVVQNSFSCLCYPLHCSTIYMYLKNVFSHRRLLLAANIFHFLTLPAPCYLSMLCCFFYHSLSESITFTIIDPSSSS
jgi:hypothetical protein